MCLYDDKVKKYVKKEIKVYWWVYVKQNFQVLVFDFIFVKVNELKIKV